MADDDVHVVMYKVLAYLYKCLKAGEDPAVANYNAGHFRINERYWTVIMVQLIDCGYVTGFTVQRADDGTDIIPVRPTVTMDGVAFMMENSMMAKARKFLESIGDIKSVIPGLKACHNGRASNHCWLLAFAPFPSAAKQWGSGAYCCSGRLAITVTEEFG